MLNELPSLPDVAAVCTAVGLLFLLRFALALHRLRVESGRRSGGVADGWGVRTASAFGAEREPERRHAARQLGVALLFLLVGLALYGWLVTASVLDPFLEQGHLAVLTGVAA